MRVFAAPLLIFVAIVPARGLEANYVSVDQIALTKLLAPPPAPQSEEQKLDLKTVLDAQRSRTPAESERAVADNNLSIYRIIDDLLGPNFTAVRLPKFDAFFDRLHKDSRAIVFATKDFYDRPRPFAVSADVHAIGELPKNSSYPSGHSTRGYLTVIIVANMVPEKRAALFARGWEYGHNRIIAGVHFPTDVEAGRITATVVAAAMMQNSTFGGDFAEAKAELRDTIGLSK